MPPSAPEPPTSSRTRGLRHSPPRRRRPRPMPPCQRRWSYRLRNLRLRRRLPAGGRGQVRPPCGCCLWKRCGSMRGVSGGGPIGFTLTQPAAAGAEMWEGGALRPQTRRRRECGRCCRRHLPRHPPCGWGKCAWTWGRRRRRGRPRGNHRWRGGRRRRCCLDVYVAGEVRAGGTRKYHCRPAVLPARRGWYGGGGAVRPASPSAMRAWPPRG